MTFQELAQRAEKKKPGRVDIIGQADATIVQGWETRGWEIVRHGEEPLRAIRAMESALPDGCGRLCWLQGFEIAGYSKVLWIGCTPSVRYDHVADAMRAVQTMIRALNSFGEAEPRVALLSCVEAISPGVPSTIWQAVLGHMGTRGQFGKAKVDGPLAFDLAVSPRAAEDKKFQSVISAQADLIVPPDLNTFLSLTDALHLTGAHAAAGVVVGGPCPILLSPPCSEDHAELSLVAASLLV
ncbi:MAG: phosphate acyltransferase [bacterium]|nr:phosphate acyltransferase [bacterium]